MLQPRLLPKELFDKLRNSGITELNLEWEGGSDEGYLHINLRDDSGRWVRGSPDLIEEIDDWSWKTYQYSGAGDGNPYGDSMTYDLENRMVYISEWYTQRIDEDADTHSFDELFVEKMKEIN